jgi:hypothetical protein
MKKILLLLVFVSFAACSDDDKRTTPCTTDFVPALSVTVKNGDIVISSGISVTATDDDYIDTLLASDVTGIFTGAHERAGTYTITVTGDGYQAYTSDPITVDEDDCHVITQDVTVQLVPVN